MKVDNTPRAYGARSKVPAPVEMQRRAFTGTIELCTRLRGAQWTRSGWKAESRQFCNDSALIQLRQLHGELQAIHDLALTRTEFKAFSNDVLGLDESILARAWLSPRQFLAAADNLTIEAAHRAQDDLLFVR